MKNLRFAFFALFLSVGLYAQSITEKDLLGRWHFIGLGGEGNYIDFETDSVYMANGKTFSDEEKEQVFGEGGLKEEVMDSYLLVKPGMIVVFKFGPDTPEESQVDLYEENGQYYIVNGSKRMAIHFKDGLLHLYPNEDSQSYAVLRKQQ